MSLLDYLRLTYWRTYTAAQDQLLFTVGSPAGQMVQSLDGFTTPDIRVFDLPAVAAMACLNGYFPDPAQESLAEALLQAENGGAGALGWYRVRHSPLQTFPAVRTLQQAYRLHAIRAAVHERVLRELFGVLRSAGVEPILIKGWAVARLYPPPGLRPYGDFDIVVRPEQHAAAVDVLKDIKIEECSVDLHRGLGRMNDQSLDALYARSQTARLGEGDIRLLGAEAHLVVLIRHFLRHNAWRPLWLCDIAAALESRPSDFDWDRRLLTNSQDSPFNSG